MKNYIYRMFSGTVTQMFAVIIACLVAFSDGMNYGWTAPIIPILLGNNTHIQTTLEECEWLEIMSSIGAFSGIPITIYLVDKIGRKKAIWLATFLSFCGWIALALVKKMVYLYIIRFFCGMVANMAFVGGPMYTAEIADEKIRGFLSSIIHLMMLMGILTIYSVAPFVSFIVPSIIAATILFIELMVLPFLPESPYFLLIKGKPEEARKSLLIFRPNRSTDIIDRELKEISKAVTKQARDRGQLQDLVLVKSNRKALIIILILNASYHLSNISVMIMNIHMILEAAGSIYIANTYAAIIFSSIMLFAGTISAFTIDKYGRKILLIISSILTGTCLLLIAIYFTLKQKGVDVISVSWIPIVAVMFYAATFKLGLGMIPIVLTAELFPANVKALGMTIADAFYVVFSFISISIYQKLSKHFGIEFPFYIFTACCFLSSIFTILVIPETKGKTLDEIQIILKGEKNNDRHVVEENIKL